MQRLLLLLILSSLLVSCTQGQSAGAEGGETGAKKATTTFYFSRHAEKTGGKDPGLLPTGEARAQRIVRKLKGENVAAVYATDYRRTQATAAPVAKAHGVETQTYDAGAHSAALVEGWLAKHKGETVFIVGHSNTVPGLVNALTGKKNYGDIDEDDYDRLFKVTVGADGQGKVTELSSGK